MKTYRSEMKYDGKGAGIGDRTALERCVVVEARAAYDGDSPSCTNVEADPQFMTFLAHAKPDGTSFVFKASYQNGLSGSLKYEKEDGSDDDCRQRNLTNDRELEIHGVEKDQDNVREKYKLGSSKAHKTNARCASIVEKQKMKDGILTKKRRNEDRDLDNRKHRFDGKIVPGKERKTQNGSKFMDAGVKIEPKEDSNSVEEATSQSEVEILENVGADAGQGSSSNPFVSSVENCKNDATIIDSGYRKEVLNLLMRPYDEEEYKKLWRDIKIQLPSSSTNGLGKSLLSRHKDVNREIKRTNHDKDKKLNIMRGFFFWLEHLTQQDAFQPWKDAECLRTMPGSS